MTHSTKLDLTGAPIEEDETMPEVPAVMIVFTCTACGQKAETVVPWSQHHSLPLGWASRDAEGSDMLPRRSEHIFACREACRAVLDERYPRSLAPRWYATDHVPHSAGRTTLSAPAAPKGPEPEEPDAKTAEYAAMYDQAAEALDEWQHWAHTHVGSRQSDADLRQALDELLTRAPQGGAAGPDPGDVSEEQGWFADDGDGDDEGSTPVPGGPPRAATPEAP